MPLFLYSLLKMADTIEKQYNDFLLENLKYFKQNVTNLEEVLIHFAFEKIITEGTEKQNESKTSKNVKLYTLFIDVLKGSLGQIDILIEIFHETGNDDVASKFETFRAKMHAQRTEGPSLHETQLTFDTAAKSQCESFASEAGPKCMTNTASKKLQQPNLTSKKVKENTGEDVKISTNETSKSIQKAITKYCKNIQTVTSLTLEHVDIVKNDNFLPLEMPCLQHLSIRYKCAELKYIHSDKTDRIKRRLKIDQFTHDGDIQKILPVKKAICEMSSISVFLNEMPLLIISETDIIMCCLQRALAQKCLDKFGLDKHHVEIFACDDHLSLPNELNKLKVFKCLGSQMNIDALKNSRLEMFLYFPHLTLAKHLHESQLSLEHLDLFTPDYLSNLCFRNAKSVTIFTTNTDNLSNLENIFPALQHLVVFDWVTENGVTNVFQIITTLAKRGCKKVVWVKRKLSKTSWWSEKDIDSFKQDGIAEPKECVKMSVSAGGPQWATFGEEKLYALNSDVGGKMLIDLLSRRSFLLVQTEELKYIKHFMPF